MKIGIIDYKAGNVRSVRFALERLGYEALLTDDVSALERCEKIIFPGVGEAASAMKILREKELDVFIKQTKKQLLGICLGMQLLCEYSEEGDTRCLGIIPTKVARFQAATNGQRYKIPHVGWNTVNHLSSFLFEGVPEDSFLYYVHGYYVPLGAYTIARTGYICEYSAALRHNNYLAVQFHPERSGSAGERILRNFLEWN